MIKIFAAAAAIATLVAAPAFAQNSMGSGSMSSGTMSTGTMSSGSMSSGSMASGKTTGKTHKAKKPTKSSSMMSGNSTMNNNAH